MKKKAFTLIEVMIVLAIAGIFLFGIMSFFRKSQQINHYKGIKSQMQAEARFLAERFFMDVQAGYKVNSTDNKNLSIEVVTEIPESSSLLNESPTVELAEYSFDAEERTVTRSFRGKSKTYYYIKDIDFQYLSVEQSGKKFNIVNASDSEKVVGITMTIHFQKSDVEFEKEPEKFNIITSAFMRTQHARLRYGVESTYGYFSSLEDDSF